MSKQPKDLNQAEDKKKPIMQPSLRSRVGSNLTENEYKKKKMQSETERSGFSGPFFFNAFPKTSKATAIAPDKLLAWDPEVAAGAFGSVALCSNHLCIPAHRVSPLVLPFPFPTSALLINQKDRKSVV